MDRCFCFPTGEGTFGHRGSLTALAAALSAATLLVRAKPRVRLSFAQAHRISRSAAQVNNIRLAAI